MAFIGANSSNTSITPTTMSATVGAYLVGGNCPSESISSRAFNSVQLNVSLTTIAGTLPIFIKLQVSDDGSNWYDYQMTNTSTNVAFTVSASGNYSVVCSPVSGTWVRAAAAGAAAMTNGTLGVNLRTFNR